MQTDPILLTILMQGLGSWLQQNPPPNPTDYPLAYWLQLRDQLVLGGGNFLMDNGPHNGRYYRTNI
jgi:hypothetical protein